MPTKKLTGRDMKCPLDIRPSSGETRNDLREEADHTEDRSQAEQGLGALPTGRKAQFKTFQPRVLPPCCRGHAEDSRWCRRGVQPHSDPLTGL